jgi:3-oxoacyl-[acyl-carrier-protein] synthase II
MSAPAAGRRRIAVTGLGICVSNGANLPEFRRSLFAGVSGIKAVSDFDVAGYRNTCAGVIADLGAEADGLGSGLDRACRIALVSAREAVRDAGLEIDAELRYRSAVCVGTSLGGMLGHVKRMRAAYAANPDTDFADPYDDVLDIPPCQIASLLCAQFGIRGGNATVVTACAAGSNSIAVAMDMIRHDRADVVLATATDPLCELSYSGFSILMALSPTVSRPFDRNRDGLVVGEGGGTLVLEEYEHAVARGARIYAEISGYGLSNDAYHATQPDPEAGGACRAIRRALLDAGLEPGDIDYINAHGTSTRYNDLMELKAVTTVYGEAVRRIPISSIKAMIGHTMGAAGTVEAIATVLALYHRFLPPTINFVAPMDEYAYDFVPVGRAASTLDAACSHSFGFGGNAACLIFRRIAGQPAVELFGVAAPDTVAARDAVAA